jgi:uncharacterized protein
MPVMSLDPSLLQILACPQDHGPLYYVASENLLYNPRLQRSYVVRDQIPVMLIEEAIAADETEHARLMGIIEAQGITPNFG